MELHPKGNGKCTDFKHTYVTLTFSKDHTLSNQKRGLEARDWRQDWGEDSKCSRTEVTRTSNKVAAVGMRCWK